MSIWAAAAHASLVRLTCPHCREIQARARDVASKVYACRKCHKRFTAAQATGKAATHQSRSTKRSTKK